MNSYFESKKNRFIGWWAKPADSGERILTCAVSFWAGLWVGAIYCVVVNQPPIPLMEIAYSSLHSSIMFTSAAAIVPKFMRCLSFPFAFIGIGGGS